MSVVWEIIEAIGRKETKWYQSIHDDVIVAKWRKEISKQFPSAGSEFDIVVNLLRATSQGSLHLSDCPWEEGPFVCQKPECVEDVIEFLESVWDEIGENTDYPNAESFVKKNENWHAEVVDLLWDDYYGNGELEICGHTRCDCICPDKSLKDYVEYGDKIIPAELSARMLRDVRKLMKNTPVDWHPDSHQRVRDIVHPSMYPFVEGVSVGNDGNLVKLPGNGEKRSKKIIQWLPSEMRKTEESRFEFSSYINNLPDEFTGMEKVIAECFNRFVPKFNQMKTVACDLMEMEKLQVIVKIGSTHLRPKRSGFGGGSWHIEGMPYERIVATGLHYLAVRNITESYLEFRKPTIIPDETELDYPQSDGEYTAHHYGLKGHHEGEMNRYIGMIKCDEGYSVVFPNSLQHRVKPFRLADPEKQGMRIILAFFLIDPRNPIVSTADIPRQQSLMSEKDAKKYRKELMFERKYFVDEMSKKIFERDFSLCEH